MSFFFFAFLMNQRRAAASSTSTFTLVTISSLFLCHFWTNKAGTTSKVSFKRSFTELSNGHGFFYVFLIGRIQNNKKYFVPFFLLQPLISKLTSLFESPFRIVGSLEYSLFKLAQQRMKKINSWKQIKICGNFSPLVAMCCFFHLDQWNEIR